jgi:hypothetical protein
MVITQAVYVIICSMDANPPTLDGRILMMEHTEYLSKIGRAGGSAKSKAKREAAQKNGELGGRPRLTTGTKDEKRRREQLREAQARRRAKLASQGK